MTEQTGFNSPFTPSNENMAAMYIYYNLGDQPTLEDIEPVATELLDDLTTAFDGAALVLNTDFQNDDTSLETLKVILNRGATGKEKFAALLLIKVMLSE